MILGAYCRTGWAKN